VAFYSDRDGEAGIWIWEKATGEANRFPGVTPRAFYGFETMRWSNDSQHILCKILPEGTSIAQANDWLRDADTDAGDHSTGSTSDRPEVVVFTSADKNASSPVAL
jgi:hypothetical protein